MLYCPFQIIICKPQFKASSGPSSFSWLVISDLHLYIFYSLSNWFLSLFPAVRRRTWLVLHKEYRSYHWELLCLLIAQTTNLGSVPTLPPLIQGQSLHINPRILSSYLVGLLFLRLYALSSLLPVTPPELHVSHNRVRTCTVSPIFKWLQPCICLPKLHQNSFQEDN